MDKYLSYSDTLSAADRRSLPGDGRQTPRLKTFSLTLIVALIAGFAYVLTLDPIYRSTASLLISAPVAIDRRSEDADVQQVAIQREILLSQPVLARTAEQVASATGAPIRSVADIRALLSAEPVADTQLVELSAEGPDKAYLPELLNHWLRVYQDTRAEDVKNNVEQTSATIARELAQLAERVAGARNQLAAFREQHNIVSAEREENEALSRLRGLNRSLSRAMEDELKAKSQLDEAREAVDSGSGLIPASQVKYVRDLENRLNAQQSRLAVLERRYTRDYINLTPEFRRIAEDVTTLEEELRSINAGSSRRAVSEAQQEYDRARRMTQNLRDEFAARKAEARAVTAVFAEHEALVTDLEELEQLYRDTLTRQAQLETREFDRHAQVALVSPASESSRIWPDYTLLIVAVVGSALLIAMFAVWLLDWLRGSRDTGGVTITGVHIYPHSPQEALSYDRAIRESLAYQDTKSLESQPPRAAE